MRWTKYGNRRTYVGDQLFDSKREAERWIQLNLMQKAGEIKDLSRQVPFELIPTLINPETGHKERGIQYIADFTYWQDGKLVVEDAKGMRTRDYMIKRKLMLWRYNIVIREV